ncbi:putative phosphoribosyltransferase [Mycobacterium tuberculosis]|nr:putative phosphoribosyltransferase [Mycobacterium tuberculosis]
MYLDRSEAGRWLGRRLRRHRARDAVVIAARPGAVPVAYEVAAALEAPLELAGRSPAAPLAGRTAIVVVEGVVTGGTARAACEAARARGARRVVLAVPVGAPAAVDALHGVADEVERPLTPCHFAAIGDYYLDDSPVPADEVARLLDAARTASAQFRSRI